MTRWYLVPVVFPPGERAAAYVHDLVGHENLKAEYIGWDRAALVRLRANESIHTWLASQQNVFQFPVDLTQTLGGNANTVINRLENLGVPSDGVTSSSTWGQVIRRLARVGFGTRCHMKDHGEDPTGALDVALTPEQKKRLADAMRTRGWDPEDIEAATTRRQAMLRLARLRDLPDPKTVEGV